MFSAARASAVGKQTGVGGIAIAVVRNGVIEHVRTLGSATPRAPLRFSRPLDGPPSLQGSHLRH
jgi:hypothetical protein